MPDMSAFALQQRHNERDGVSNHRRLGCFLNRLFRHSQHDKKSSASLAFVRGIHRWPVNSPHKGPVTRKMFPFDDVIIYFLNGVCVHAWHVSLQVAGFRSQLMGVVTATGSGSETALAAPSRCKRRAISYTWTYWVMTHHYRVMPSQITGNLAVCTTSCSGQQQRNNKGSLYIHSTLEWINA